MAEDNIAAVIAQARATNATAIRDNSSTNKNYTSEWNLFVKFVDSHADCSSGPPWLTRSNIDIYFSVHIAASRCCNKGALRRVVNSLQWFAKNKIFPREKFEVESPIVLEAINSLVPTGRSAANPGSDPHVGLKDAISHKDRKTIMSYIYASRHDWAPAAVNFSYGHNGAVRGASNRMLTLSDLNMSYSFGPERDGPLSRAFMLVIRKGAKNKDRHESDKQVCFWRHRSYLLCSVFATAAHVLFKLQGEEIDFLKPNKTFRPKWWDIPFLDWDKYSGKKIVVLYNSPFILHN